MKKIRFVPGFEGLYQVSIESKEGKCYSFYNKNWGLGKAHQISNKPTKKSGRIFWGLHKNGKNICRQAAYWIAITFPELVQNEYFEGAVIDHINTDVLDNRPCNLRWVTHKGNTNNPLTLKKFKNNEYVHSVSTPVEQFGLEGNYIAFYSSIHEAAKQTGVSTATIKNCCEHKFKKPRKYLWRYACWASSSHSSIPSWYPSL